MYGHIWKNKTVSSTYYKINANVCISDEGYTRNVSDEGYTRNVPDDDYIRNGSCVLILYLRFVPHVWIITGFVTSITRRVPHVEQEILTFPDYLSSSRFLARFVLLDVLFSVGYSVDHFPIFFVCPLCFLSFFHLRLLTTPLVSSNFLHNCGFQANISQLRNVFYINCIRTNYEINNLPCR